MSGPISDGLISQLDSLTFGLRLRSIDQSGDAFLFWAHISSLPASMHSGRRSARGTSFGSPSATTMQRSQVPGA